MFQQRHMDMVGVSYDLIGFHQGRSSRILSVHPSVQLSPDFYPTSHDLIFISHTIPSLSFVPFPLYESYTPYLLLLSTERVLPWRSVQSPNSWSPLSTTTGLKFIVMSPSWPTTNSHSNCTKLLHGRTSLLLNWGSKDWTLCSPSPEVGSIPYI